jgi:uncharacterized cupredoxin-like copper-binding protein
VRGVPPQRGNRADPVTASRIARMLDRRILPTKGKEASEAGAVGEIREQKPGKSGARTFKLKPGRYVYICNAPGHYKAGMRGTLTVK